VIIPIVIGATGLVTKGFKEEFGSHFMKSFNRFTTKCSYIRNIAHNTESTGILNYKPVRWRSSLVPWKYQGEKSCDKINNNNNNKIIIIIIYSTLYLIYQ